LPAQESDSPRSASAGPAVGPSRFSVGGLVALVFALTLIALAAAAAFAIALLPVSPWIPALLVLLPGLPLSLWALSRALRPLRSTVNALSDGIRGFRDGDFSLRIASKRQDELGDLVRLYNEVTDFLREERSAIRQRELLLQSALDRSPTAIVLVNPLDRIIYANEEARRLFRGGERMAGFRFGEMVTHCPEEMRRVLRSGEDGIFTIGAEGGDVETYHLAQRDFLLNRQQHKLCMLRRLTAELGRQEAEIWKKVIRVISHELNNSLAPVSSLAHSARLIAEQEGRSERLEPVFGSIRERIEHLRRFLEGYARFARLPKPRKRQVEWPEFLEAVRELYDFELEGDLPRGTGYFDPTQLQQVLINLLKNATEASDGGCEISVRLRPTVEGGTLVEVLDRGRGMTEEVMHQALLPFYSTKPSGSGVGLPLCREIVEAHGGKLSIQLRQGGGTVVSCWLPPERRQSP
jgi:nitrogen fixation/metabolism regulation signal transduction histidine kinase